MLKTWPIVSSAPYLPRIATVYDKCPDRMPFDFPEVVAALAPRPFFTNSPLHDGNFEVSGVRDSLTAARPIFALYGQPDHLQSVHPDTEHDFADEPRMQSYAFLDQYLKVPAQK